MISNEWYMVKIAVHAETAPRQVLVHLHFKLLSNRTEVISPINVLVFLCACILKGSGLLRLTESSAGGRLQKLYDSKSALDLFCQKIYPF